ncbi:MAG TPA: class I SAM-dependent methyltransferase [Blastocatellia bacterium]|nr:class I SAM-dependent methyltransferase [Blastocatellia bacterium]
MREEEYRAMFEVEERLWWYEGMRAITSSMLDDSAAALRNGRMLDVGCGTGFSMMWLRRQFESNGAFGVDVSEHAIEFWRKRGLDTATVARAGALPFSANEFDLVTCFDVVYQLEAPAAREAIAEMNRVLRQGGLLLIREPAYDWLRGSHDVAVATRHRYTRSELRRLLESSGFAIRRSSYANTLLFPAAVAHRLLSKGGDESDVHDVSGLMNKTLGAALKLEARFLAHTSFPFGLSVIALAEKSR